MSSSELIYPSLSCESEDLGVTEIESLCMKCYKTGVTKLLLTKIPHYKEVVITSFECQFCYEKNNGIQTTSVQDFGVKYDLQLKTPKDLSRQIVKSHYSSILIPCVELDIPPAKGEITTIEGVLLKAIEELELDQPTRKEVDNKLFGQIQNFISRLKKLLHVEEPFNFILDDPSGNSYLENSQAPNTDPQLNVITYTRTAEQNTTLGILESEENASEGCSKVENKEPHSSGKLNLKEEVLQFNTNCDHCSRPSCTKMKVTEIPHFKEVVIMATECESCGHRSNEVKSCAGIEEKGQKYTLKIQDLKDLSRDVLKSETCSISIPEVDLNIGAGVFVGKFTTVEGLLCDIQKDLEKNPFLLGDSASKETKDRIHVLINDIQKVIEGAKSVQLVMDDPAGNSYVQRLDESDAPDQSLECVRYKRSFDQNEELGLNDMVTENYSTTASADC